MERRKRKWAASLELDYSGDPQWHKTGSDKWYFSGPYYCQAPKFRYKTLGLPAQTRLKFRVLKGTTVEYEEDILSSANWRDVTFAGHLNKPVPAERNYLVPETAYKAELMVTGSTATAAVEKPFSVKSRTVWWIDTQDDADPVTPDGIGSNAKALAYQLRPAGGKISDDVNSDADILLLEHSNATWGTAYGYLTVAATFYSVGHGARTATPPQKYGAIYLPVNRAHSGFGTGTNFPGATPYPVSALGLWDLKVWLKHCWTADASPPAAGTTVDGPSVAISLDKILEQGVGSSKTYGYKGLYTNLLEVRASFNRILHRPQGAQVDSNAVLQHLYSLLPTGEAFVDPPFNGDPSKVNLAPIEAALEAWTTATFNLTDCDIQGISFDPVVTEPNNTVIPT